MNLSNVTDGVQLFAEKYMANVLASPVQQVAHLCALLGVALVVAGAFTRTMMPLRWLAAGSNVGLLAYGLLHPSPTTALVAATLLPINLYRAIEVTRLTRRVVRAGVGADMASMWLRPYMKARRLRPGQTLFSKGDSADKLFLLADGQMVLSEIGVPIEPGRIFGEIALFSPDHSRTHTVSCLTACTVLEIDESTVRQLFFQNPSFAFHLMELLAKRLGSDIARARADLPAAWPPPPAD